MSGVVQGRAVGVEWLGRAQSDRAVVIGVDIGATVDRTALAAVRYRAGESSTDRRWRVERLAQLPTGTRSTEGAELVAEFVEGARRRFRPSPVEVAVDATGLGDPWVDALVAVGLRPLAVRITGSVSAIRFDSFVLADGVEVPRVTLARDRESPNAEVPSLFGSLLSAGYPMPGERLARLTVSREAKRCEAGVEFRRQLAGIEHRNGRPDHASGEHDDLALAVALAVWPGFAPLVDTGPTRAFSAASIRLDDGRGPRTLGGAPWPAREPLSGRVEDLPAARAAARYIAAGHSGDVTVTDANGRTYRPGRRRRPG